MSDPSCQIPHSWLSCYIACAFWQWSQPLRPWNPSMSTWTFLFSLYWSLTWTLFSLFSITAWQSSLWTIVDLVYFWLCQGQKDYYQHLIYFQTIFKESILFQIKVTLMASWMPDVTSWLLFWKASLLFWRFFSPHYSEICYNFLFVPDLIDWKMAHKTTGRRNSVKNQEKKNYDSLYGFNEENEKKLGRSYEDEKLGKCFKNNLNYIYYSVFVMWTGQQNPSIPAAFEYNRGRRTFTNRVVSMN